LEEHKNWRVPERRVAKFVKRFRRAPGAAGDDDDMSTMSAMSTASSVVSQRARSVVKGVGNILHLRSRMTKNKLDKESTRDHPAVVSLLGDISPHDDGVSEVHEDDPLDSLLFASPVPPNHPAGSPIFSPSPVKGPKEKIKETQPDDSEAVTALESVVEEAETEAELKGRALAFADDEDGLVYADENDGKKQGGLCEPCEGCSIL
jgi:hypothetical protein